ncbi:head-tail connector protein [Palleronia caenipelagi]|nr:hypothetical protein [Palleronia caenipelagi]
MDLTEEIPLASALLPLAELRSHLRLGTGFADDAVQNPVLEQILRAALARVEQKTGKSVLTRRFVAMFGETDGCGAMVLPRAPVGAVVAVTRIGADGARSELAPSTVRLEDDPHRPRLHGVSIPSGGVVEVIFDAGYGASWADVPADLAQAVLSLAGAAYEDRSATEDISEGVRAMLAPYRMPRLFGGHNHGTATDTRPDPRRPCRGR